ncbi:MAG: hypothetical protein LC650_03875 [Actinobacteria bacterium]|nr:hypothetical protein [Actinomycetota bacterium]
MKTNKFRHTPDGDIYYYTDFGVFTKEISHRGYSVHIYNVRKIDGEWPSEKELMAFCDDRTSYFGGSATIKGDGASVTCYID